MQPTSLPRHDSVTDHIGALELNLHQTGIDDAALENSAGWIYAGVSNDTPCAPTTDLRCHFTRHVGCRLIDDAALENAGAKLYAGPTSTSSPCTHMRRSDGSCAL